MNRDNSYLLAKPVILQRQLEPLPSEVANICLKLLNNELAYEENKGLVPYASSLSPTSFGKELYFGSEAAILHAQLSGHPLMEIKSIPAIRALELVSVGTVDETMKLLGQIAISNNRLGTFVKQGAPGIAIGSEYQILQSRVEKYFTYLIGVEELNDAVPKWLEKYLL